jgi:CBS domain-containing protein
MSVGRICRREVHLASGDEPVVDAARRMSEHNVGTLVVLDDEKRPVGVLTDRDIALRVVGCDRPARTTRVAQVMSAVSNPVGEDTPIEDVLSLMRAGPFRRVPVVARDGSLVGVVSLDDVLELLAEEFQTIGGILRAEAPVG